nr:TonB-dependent receptor plug domain-containing protein [Chryseolinea sp.]
MKVISYKRFLGALLCMSFLFGIIPKKIAAQDSLAQKQLDEVVVTATRSERALSELPVPVTVIQKSQIKNMGSLRLNDVLGEQTGLAIVSDHRTGIQMQGFSPEYTLILVDGEPLIGRTSGTLELNRIAVGNIKQIEIMKGPSSSLYGSEALAGVVNIITERPIGVNGTITSRYGANNTFDLGATVNYKKNKLGLYAFANRYSTDGYDLSTDTEGNTVSPFAN